MILRYKLLSLVAVALVTASAPADSFVYVINDAAQFGTIDLQNGAFAVIGSGLPEGSAGLVDGPNGSLLTLGFSGQLYTINPATGGVAAVGTGTGLNGSNMGLNFANTLGEVGTTVYATDMSNSLYAVNTTTGVATPIGPTGIPGDPECGSFPNLCDEGLFTLGGNLFATYDAFLLASDGYTSNVTANPNLWEIDPTTGMATLVSPTQLHILTETNVGGTIYGFEGFPGPTAPLPNPVIDIVTLNPSDGDTSVVTQVTPAAGGIYGVVAVSSTPEPASLVLVGSGLVALAAKLRRRRI